jgi:LuxR family transcriptional regulator, maltose regulon positive regulatory protein
VAHALAAPVRHPDSTWPVDEAGLDLKFRPARLPSDVVPRERLVRRLLDARDLPVVLIVAPAGYGKTTLLSQWSERDPRPFAWVTLDAEDSDPRNLVRAIAVALDGVEPSGLDATRAALHRLAGSLIRREGPAVLVLDNVEALRTAESRRVLTTLWPAFGGGLQLVLASRGDAGLPIARLRVHGESMELRTEDLAMTRSEASAFLRRAGVDLTTDQAHGLARRTQGWPAGLHLATLSLHAQARDHPDVDEFTGDDRIVVDYVRQELLSGLSRAELEFLTRTSVLDPLSPELCDELLGRTDSARMLARLSHSNVLLAPLDRRDSAYRYHELFAEALRAELRSAEPGRDAELHRHASAWWGARGDAERAIDHAIEAHDLQRAARLLWEGALEHCGRSEHAVVWSRLHRFPAAELDRSPLLALVAAGTSLVEGNLDEAERWAAVARRAADGTKVVRAGLALVRAGIGRGALAEVSEGASEADELLGPPSPWRSLSGLLSGVALQLTGERDRALERLRDGAHRAAVAAPLVQVLCLAQLALLAAEDDDLERAAMFADRATSQIRRCGLEGCPSAALALAVSAELRARGGQVAEATSEQEQALRLLERIVDPSPWYEAECRILVARTAYGLSGPAAGARHLDQAARAVARVPDACVLRDWLEQARAQVELGGSAGAEWSLTTAELRVLRFLPSHLAFREIADRLYVSPNTVKTHARGIYRKLDVSSRGDAVEVARGAGLLDLGSDAQVDLVVRSSSP